MATLYIDEYTTVGGGPSTTGANHNPVQAPLEPKVQTQFIAISGSSTQSPLPFAATTRVIRVHTDSICSIAIGPNPTAVTTAQRLAANQTDVYAVQNGHYIAVIANV